MNKKLLEREKEINCIKSTYSHHFQESHVANDPKNKKPKGNDYAPKEKKEEKIKKDQKLYEFEQKINGIEKTLNELKFGIVQKETNHKNTRGVNEAGHYSTNPGISKFDHQSQYNVQNQYVGQNQNSGQIYGKQNQYGGQNQYSGQNQYGKQNQYGGQNQNIQSLYGQNQYGQNQYGQNQYGQNQYEPEIHDEEKVFD